MHDFRPGEETFATDPATIEANAGVVFIGYLQTPWSTREDCPKNIRQARERAQSATIHLHEDYRPALRGLTVGQWIFVLYWMDEARRDLAIQAPRHRESAVGTFALRSPVRPNPIALALVQLKTINEATGDLIIDAIDCRHATPVLDIKPYLASVDAPPDAGRHSGS